MPTNKININHTKTNHNEHNISSLVYVGMFAILECVCEPTLSHQTASIKSLQKCGPYMPMAVLIRFKSKRATLMYTVQYSIISEAKQYNSTIV